jgi:hypothetical protein
MRAFMHGKEHWKYIEGFDYAYKISSFGKVKSMPRKFWNGKAWWNSKEKVLKLYESNSCYLYVSLYKSDGSHANYWIHRLVAETFFGKFDLEVNHIDGDKKNNNILNLEFVTSKRNKQHAWEIGLYNENTRKKLSEATLGIKRSKKTKILMSIAAKNGWIKRRLLKCVQ